MKKICCITTCDITFEPFVVEAMHQFVDKGYDVYLVSNMSERFKQAYEHEYHCIHLPMNRGISIRDMIVMPFRFYNLFKREKFDLIQYATPNASLYASIGAWMARMPIRLYCQWGIRYVGLSGVMRRVLKTLEHLTCKLSTDICPASRKNLEYAVSEGLYKANKAAIIGDGGTVGVDLMKYDLMKKTDYREEIFTKYPKLKGATVFCSVGRMTRDKGSFELLEAFLQLAKERDDVILMMIGRNEDSLPIHLAEALKHDRIIVTGYTFEVYKYLSAADVLVHPSYREGFSMVIQEAMAMGLAVVTTDIPGPSEVIEKDVTGILVEARSTSSLLDGMRQMIADPERMKLMGEAGRKRCEELFNRERMLQLTYEHRIRLMDRI